MENNKDRTPWYLWPFKLIWDLALGILKLTGRLVGALIGLAILIVGVVLSITVIGAIIGVPLVILGLMLMVRSIF